MTTRPKNVKPADPLDLSLRDRFAAIVMQCLIDRNSAASLANVVPMPIKDIAAHAYDYADAMLVEREKHR